MKSDAADIGLFIDGVSTPSRSNLDLAVLSPYTGRTLFYIPGGSAEDVNRAVASARNAFDDGRWRDCPPSLKKRALSRLADLISAESAQLDILDAQEMGKPISVTFGNAEYAAALVRFYAESVDKITGDVFTSDASSFVAQRRVPRGVVAAIVPWNFPTTNVVMKIAPALAAGNTVVLKPSELASRSALLLAELAVQAGIPPGVFNVALGRGNVVGRALAQHMDVDMVAFTGSTTVGKLVQEYAGQSNLKSVLSECGGKSPQIVFADMEDLDGVADGVAFSILTNMGQWCSAGSRLIVQEKIESALLDKLVQRFNQLTVGDPCDPVVTFGPLATRQQYEKVARFINIGREHGAELVTGGHRLLPDTGGNFLAPALLRKVTPDMEIWREEIFGPVLSVTTFKDEAEAIRLANSTIFGLVATVWTSSLAAGMRLSRDIRSGVVMVNACAPAGEGSQAMSAEPYGQSGNGTELGIGGMESYLRRQLVYVNHGTGSNPFRP
jgi:acyl-CoA reductase-like NAD-dependent aldehyde dehydrogenase